MWYAIRSYVICAELVNSFLHVRAELADSHAQVVDIGMFTDFRSTCRTPAVKLISSTGKATGTLPRMPMYLGKQLLRSDVIMDFKYSLHLSGIKRTTAARTMFNGGHAPNNRFKFGYCTTSHGSRPKPEGNI
jgi:hypothetical protein